MQRFMNQPLGFLLLLVATASFCQPAMAQNITGALTAGPGFKSLDPGEPIADAAVSFFDALNAELIAATTTADDGSYNSGFVPVGPYRVRLSRQGSRSDYLVFPEYHGAGDANDAFCDGAVVEVVFGDTAIADEDLLEAEPRLVVSIPGTIRGSVLDSEGNPLEGIEVRFLDALNALEDDVVLTAATGEYILRKDRWPPGNVKVRFVDPELDYFPQYFQGVDGPRSDDYCAAAEIDLREQESVNINAVLERVPRQYQTELLIDAIDDLMLADQAARMLTMPLIRVVDLIADDNPQNDGAVCAQLDAFASRVGIQERRGQISEAEADYLLALTAAALESLGCA